MNHQKGMSMALTIVISIVVLIVVSLAVIAITTGNLANTGSQSNKTTGDAFNKINTAVENTNGYDSDAGGSGSGAGSQSATGGTGGSGGVIFENPTG